MVPALVALVVGLGAGLDRLGVPVPTPMHGVDEVHGVLLVMGFVGTLIAIERAVALGHAIGYLAPAALGLGGVLLASGVTRDLSAVTVVLGATALVGLYVPLWRRQRDDAVLVQALGAVLALGGCLLWWGGVPMSAVVPWLSGFVVLTIAGERLELARVTMHDSVGRDLVLLAVGLCAAVVASLLWPGVGAAVLGALLLSIGIWLWRYDVARHTVRSSGLPRYMAGCMLTGQAWLVIAAAIWLVAGPLTAGPTYDASVHAVFLGYTMSMIMAHAPIILPAVTRLALPYHPMMYGPVVLLQASLVIRVWAGDALETHLARQVGGVGNAVAVLGFLVVAGWCARRASVFGTTDRDAATPGVTTRGAVGLTSAGRGSE